MRLSWWQKVTKVLGFGTREPTIHVQNASSVGNRVFAARDIILLRPAGRSGSDGKLTKPLSQDGKIESHKGTILHSEIIGKSARDLVKSTTGAAFRAHHVSLSDYVRLSRRLVTPIYPADANVIVSLFDIHVPRPTPSAPSNERYEILEAGTGHGALTLHLSRAIHAGNPPMAVDQNEQEWRGSRQAVLHTIDISEKYSKHAEKIVAGFRKGVYSGNINFNVGSVSDWVRAEIERRSDKAAFLSNAFLDLPGLEDHLATVSSVLLPDSKLIVFAPSVTQILACFEKARKAKLPLVLGQVIELGTNGSSGGREWDVRAVVPRDKIKRRKAESEVSERAPQDVDVRAETSEDELSLESETSAADSSAAEVEVEPEPDAEEKIVCRPKVGDRITGGGFLAVFIKKGAEE
ncbi:Hypothetical protein D9617_5g068770 [Elsinoe fawcettii]|nr:Hypothetical protein D9617_5g068770 [Elsinoe fawcettii]